MQLGTCAAIVTGSMFTCHAIHNSGLHLGHSAPAARVLELPLAHPTSLALATPSSLSVNFVSPMCWKKDGPQQHASGRGGSEFFGKSFITGIIGTYF
ncbi:hypothetical protein HDU98_004344 [Podochytrium sp. JEL0797]|nr:hypothetical protein HDU98_004344 [Podochytrium sp. JEL0797]